MVNAYHLLPNKDTKWGTSASIFKRMSDAPEQQQSSALDYTAAYKVTFILLASKVGY